jgi:hypothetical protein
MKYCPNNKRRCNAWRKCHVARKKGNVISKRHTYKMQAILINLTRHEWSIVINNNNRCDAWRNAILRARKQMWSANVMHSKWMLFW